MDLFLINILLFLIAVGFSVFASYFDIKTGEIPDKFTLGLVIVALALRAGYSVYSSEYSYLLDGAITGAIFFAFGALLFYTGGWGGGDAKLITGIGASLGGYLPGLALMDPTLGLFPAFFGFFVSISLVAIPYSIAYSLFLSMRSPKSIQLFRGRIRKGWAILLLALVASFALILVLRPWSPLLTLALLSPPLMYLLMVFVRCVEEEALRKEVFVSDLREGDMVAEDVVLRGKKLASRRDMDGLSKQAVKEIKRLAAEGKLPKRITVKWGIKFAPVFPLALLVTPFLTGILGFFL
jgi:Flp pilus assembly protein protease CpaA